MIDFFREPSQTKVALRVGEIDEGGRRWNGGSLRIIV